MVRCDGGVCVLLRTFCLKEETHIILRAAFGLQAVSAPWRVSANMHGSPQRLRSHRTRIIAQYYGFAAQSECWLSAMPITHQGRGIHNKRTRRSPEKECLSDVRRRRRRSAELHIQPGEIGGKSPSHLNCSALLFDKIPTREK